MATSECEMCGGAQTLSNGALCPACKGGELPGTEETLKDSQEKRAAQPTPKPKAP